MFGILHNCVSQHITSADFKQLPVEFKASEHPYTILVERFPSALAFFTSRVKHRWLDSQTAPRHDGELQKQKMLAEKEHALTLVIDLPLLFIHLFWCLFIIRLFTLTSGLPGVGFYRLCFHNFWHNLRKLAKFFIIFKKRINPNPLQSQNIFSLLRTTFLTTCN